jgi:hypothetical protein
LANRPFPLRLFGKGADITEVILKKPPNGSLCPHLTNKIGCFSAK